MMKVTRVVFVGCLLFGAAGRVNAQECVVADVYKAQSLAQKGQLAEIAVITQRCSTEVNVLLAYAQAGVMQAKLYNDNPQQQSEILANVWTALDRIDGSTVFPQDYQARLNVRKETAVLLAEMSERSEIIIPLFLSEASLPVCPNAASLPVQTLFYKYQKSPKASTLIYARKIAEACSDAKGSVLNPNYYYALMLGHQADLEPNIDAALQSLMEARRILDKILGTSALNSSHESDIGKILQAQARIEFATGTADPLSVMQGDMSGALSPLYLEALIGYGANAVWGPDYAVGKTDESKAKHRAQFFAYTSYISKLDKAAREQGEDMRWILYRGLSGHAEGKYRTDDRRAYKVYVDFPWKMTRPKP
ncbi:MAG: hypothetical protein ACSHXY_02955 [Alphaproteobacteria bacterium]